MSKEWKDCSSLQSLAAAEAMGWEIEFSQHNGAWSAWQGIRWQSSWFYRARPKQPKTVDLPIADVVQLQNAADGLWAHFRIGKGYAYSICLDTDQWGKRFANEYRAVAGSPPAQPKTKKVKMQCYLKHGRLEWLDMDCTPYDAERMRIPAQDIEIEVPDNE